MADVLLSWAVVGVVVPLAVGVGVGVMSMTPPQFLLAKACFSIAGVVLLAKMIAWGMTATRNERILCTLAVGAAFFLWAASWQWVTALQPPRLGVITETAPTSTIAASALATNIRYPNERMRAGIEWQKWYDELRVDVVNTSDSPIQNLNLLLETPIEDKTKPSLMFGVGQTSRIPNVEFHRPDYSENVETRFKAKDGSVMTLRSKDLFDGEMALLSTKWEVFCPRLLGKAELRLVVATAGDVHTGSYVTKVHISGNYELMPSAGSKIVAVDTTVNVRR